MSGILSMLFECLDLSLGATSLQAGRAGFIIYLEKGWLSVWN